MLMFCVAIIGHTKPCRCGRLFRKQRVIFDMIISRWASLTDWQILCIFQIDCLQCQHGMFTYSITFQLAYVALGRWGGGITKFIGRETDLPSDPSLKKIGQNIDDCQAFTYKTLMTAFTCFVALCKHYPGSTIVHFCKCYRVYSPHS